MKNKKQARYVFAVRDSRAAGRIEKVCFQTEIKDTLFKYIFFVLFFLPSSSPCLKDQFAVYFSTSCYCTDPGLQLGDPAPLIGLLL